MTTNKPEKRGDAHAALLLGELIDSHFYTVDEILHAFADVCLARAQLAYEDKNDDAGKAWLHCRKKIKKVADHLTELGRVRQ